MFKKISTFFLISLAMFTIQVQSTKAVDLWGEGDNNGQTLLENTAGFDKGADPRKMVANGIKIFLGFLGLISVVLILYAGFLWMTSAGEETKVKKAKDILWAAVIGLVIVLMSYGLAIFVLEQIATVTEIGV
jgi:amino acid transporter